MMMLGRVGGIRVPEPVSILTRKFITGVQKNEEKERKQDIAYMKRKSCGEFTKLPDLGHGG